jgi:hypothetical protein
MMVYVATIATRYEIVAAADTAEGAVRLACEYALRWLIAEGAVSSDTDTADKVADYFGVTVTRVALNTAALAGEL